MSIERLREEITDASQRTAKWLPATPLRASRPLESLTGQRVFFKLDNFQITGSFKYRGALSKMTSLAPEVRERGVVAASTGNHGAAVAESANLFGAPATIYVPTNALHSKIETIRRYPVEVHVEGKSCEEAEAIARKAAADSGRTFISPYNDWQVVGGQGTCGVEISAQAEKVDHVFVSVGGGGLVAGVACAVKQRFPSAKIVGVSPKNDCAMYESLKAGRIVKMDAKPTLSDGTAGGVEPGSITFSLCEKLIDEFLLPSEEEIAESLRETIETHKFLIEGAAAVAIAGFKQAARTRNLGTSVVVLCGGNLGGDRLTVRL